MTEASSYRLLLAALFVVMLATAAASLAIGYVNFSLSAAVLDVLSGTPTLGAVILEELRLPRTLLGLIVGFTLGLAGAAMQGFLRNPLAEPGIIGVSGAASLGAVLVFYFGLAGVFSFALPLGGIAGAVVAGIALFALAGSGASTTTLILAGVAINSLAGALVALALNLSPSPYAAVEIMFWLMGSLADRSLAQVFLVLPAIIIGWLLLLVTGRALDALSLGEETAASLGFDMRHLRLMVISGTSLAVGSSVAISGAIGFVGLVVPHLLRPLVGHVPRNLLLASGLGGAILTLAADIAVRLIDTQPELKLGVITAIIGAPFLLSLIWRLRRDPA
jgi:iron complex transport system permease protein